LRVLIILALIFLLLVFLLANTVANQDVTLGVRNTGGVTSQPRDDPSLLEALSVPPGADIPFRNRDGITLYMPYRSGFPLVDGKGFSPSSEEITVAFLSSHGSRDTQGATEDDDNTDGQHPNPSGYGGNSGFWWLPQSPSWAGNLEASGLVDFGEASGPDNASDGTLHGPGNGPGTGNNPGPDFDGVPPKGTLPIVKQEDPPQPVPEPGSLALFASAFASFFFVLRKCLGIARK
jgi:hypothetical protein